MPPSTANKGRIKHIRVLCGRAGKKNYLEILQNPKISLQNSKNCQWFEQANFSSLFFPFVWFSYESHLIQPVGIWGTERGPWLYYLTMEAPVSQSTDELWVSKFAIRQDHLWSRKNHRRNKFLNLLLPHKLSPSKRLRHLNYSHPSKSRDSQLLSGVCSSWNFFLCIPIPFYFRLLTTSPFLHHRWNHLLSCAVAIPSRAENGPFRAGRNRARAFLWEGQPVCVSPGTASSGLASKHGSRTACSTTSRRGGKREAGRRARPTSVPPPSSPRASRLLNGASTPSILFMPATLSERRGSSAREATGRLLGWSHSRGEASSGISRGLPRKDAGRLPPPPPRRAAPFPPLRPRLLRARGRHLFAASVAPEAAQKPWRGADVLRQGRAERGLSSGRARLTRSSRRSARFAQLLHPRTAPLPPSWQPTYSPPRPEQASPGRTFSIRARSPQGRNHQKDSDTPPRPPSEITVTHRLRRSASPHSGHDRVPHCAKPRPPHRLALHRSRRATPLSSALLERGRAPLVSPPRAIAYYSQSFHRAKPRPSMTPPHPWRRFVAPPLSMRIRRPQWVTPSLFLYLWGLWRWQSG